MMNNKQPGLLELGVKTIIVHSVSYMLMGIIASTYLNYKEAYAVSYMACWMRQFGDPLLTAGPLFQPLRGVVFALAFYPLREVLFNKKYGWAVMWWLLVAIGILSPFGPPPGSIEGMVYTVIPIAEQVRGYLEIIPQAFLLAVGVTYWVNHRDKKWLNWILGFLFVLTVVFPILGILAG
jgi:hypothetical protein